MWLSDYYTYKVCAPSRAATMTGRYPWGVGFYDMSLDAEHCVPTSTTLLPEVMRGLGYRTHSTGKWDVGYVKSECTPTERGFESFLGYYTACTSDYWYHGAPGHNATMSACGGVDFSDSTAAGGISGAPMHGPNSLNGTYDRDVFTQRAIDVINDHNQSEPLFLYVAYHNVHDSCMADRLSSLGLDAPKASVELYKTTKLDTWKVQAAMTTELDYGVGNITETLKRNGMWNNTVLVFVSDNGGPLDHSSNAPLRAGKGHWFEGGVRVVGAVASPLLPLERRGTTWSGMAHSSDWYVTLVEGVAGGALPSSTGPRAPDGHNLWPALLANATSPRTEVIHGVNGSQVVPPVNKTQCSSCSSLAARFGDYKIILGVDGGPGVQAWPTPGASEVPFGRSGGKVEGGTDHYRAPLLDKEQQEALHGADEGGSASTMLFHLPSDPSEQNNLAGLPEHAAMIEDFKQRLKEAAETGPAPAHVNVPGLSDLYCQQEEATGYLEPIDWKHK